MTEEEKEESYKTNEIILKSRIKKFEFDKYSYQKGMISELITQNETNAKNEVKRKIREEEERLL